MNSQRTSLHPDASTLGWLTVAAVALGACGDESISPLATQASPLTATHRGADVEAHPAYAHLSDELSDGMGIALRQMAAISPAEREALQAEVALCSGGEGAGCESLLAHLGFPSARVQQIARGGAQIVQDLRLPAGEVVPAFTDAQFLHEGVGDESELVSLVLSSGLVCGAACQEHSGNSLGVVKGQISGALAISSCFQRSCYIDLSDLAERIREILGKFPPPPRPECSADSDCPPDEFCHRLGVNDCRPRRPNGALCTRGGQCASGRCVPHISNFFLPTCRP